MLSARVCYTVMCPGKGHMKASVASTIHQHAGVTKSRSRTILKPLVQSHHRLALAQPLGFAGQVSRSCAGSVPLAGRQHLHSPHALDPAVRDPCAASRQSHPRRRSSPDNSRNIPCCLPCLARVRTLLFIVSVSGLNDAPEHRGLRTEPADLLCRYSENRPCATG